MSRVAYEISFTLSNVILFGLACIRRSFSFCMKTT